MITRTAYDVIVDALRDHGSHVKETGDSKAVAQCPAHDDHNPSLGIDPRRDGKGVVITCRSAGCTHLDILGALGLTERDLFDDDGMRNVFRPRADYRYPGGRVNHRKVNGDGSKKFWQENSEDHSLFGAELIGDADLVYVCEGEKAAEAIHAEGAAAVATGGSQRKSDWTPLVGRNVRIIADRDTAGCTWATTAAEALAPVAASLTVVQAAVDIDKADVVEHLTAGYTLDELVPVDWWAPATEDEPIPLTVTAVDMPSFPVDALPDVIAQKVAELAEFTQTDPAMAATSALTVLATCIGGHAKIQIRPGWREPLCLYSCTIARPAERKSAVQESMVAPLHDAEAAMSFAGEVERLTLQDELEMAKKTIDQLNKAAVNAAAKAAKPEATDKDKRAAADAAKAAKDAKAAMRGIQVPVIPRLLADDVTPEATASLLADHGGRIAIVSAEGGIFDTIAGRYAKTVNLDVFLKGHSGDRIRVDRQGRPAQYIPSPALTMGLMVQPRIIEAIAANRDFVGRGLLARFLYATPVSKVGFRLSTAVPVSENTEAQYSHWIKKLASDMAGWSGDPAVLMLDDLAEAHVRKIQDAVEPTLAGEGELASPPTLTEWGGKYVGAVVRIAGLLHLGEHGEVGHSYPVQLETIKKAERIGRYFKAAAINVFTAMGADPEAADAVYLLDRIVALDVEMVSERDMFSGCNRSRFSNMAAMMPALHRLVEHGYLIPREQPRKTGGGRPPSPVFKLHPSAANAAYAAQRRS